MPRKLTNSPRIKDARHVNYYDNSIDHMNRFDIIAGITKSQDHSEVHELAGRKYSELPSRIRVKVHKEITNDLRNQQSDSHAKSGMHKAVGTKPKRFMGLPMWDI